MYDAYDWVFEAERDLQGIEKEMPPVCDDPTVPFGIGPERRRRRSRSHLTDAAERQPARPGARESELD